MKKRGRPPRGPFDNKGAVFSTRITRDLRNELERAAGDFQMSLSQTIEVLLRNALGMPDKFETIARRVREKVQQRRVRRARKNEK